MFVKKYIAIFSTSLFLTSAASADVNYTYVTDETYLQVYGGFFQVQNVDVGGSAQIHNVTVSASYEYSFDYGYSVGGRYGFPLFPVTTPFLGKFRAEVEGGFHEADYDALDGSVTVTAGGNSTTFGGSAPVDGHIEVVDVYLNLIYDTDETINLPNIDTLTFTPYLGWGLGYSHVTDYIRTIGHSGDQLVVDAEEKGTEWGIQAFIGADINLGETINVWGQDLVGGLRANIRRRNQGEKGVDDAFALGGQFYLGYKF